MKKSHMKKIAKEIATLEKQTQQADNQEEMIILMARMEKLLGEVQELDDLDQLDDLVQKYLRNS